MKPKVKRCEVKGDKFMRGGIAGDVYSLQNPEQFKELITIYNDLSEKSDLIKGYYLDHTDNSIVFLTEPNISDLGKDEIYGYVEPLKEKGFSIIDFDKSVNYKKYRFGLDWGTEKGSMVKQDGKEGMGNPQWFKLYLKKQIKFDGGGQVMAKESYEVGDKIRFRDKYRNQEHDGIIDEINERGTYVVGYGSGLTTGIRAVEKEEVIGAYPKVEVKKKRFSFFDNGGEMGGNESGSSKNRYTDYYLIVDLDERGEYKASVYNPEDKVVFRIESAEEMNDMIESGYLKAQADEDLDGLTQYLMEMEIIPNYSQVYSEDEFESKIRENYEEDEDEYETNDECVEAVVDMAKGVKEVADFFIVEGKLVIVFKNQLTTNQMDELNSELKGIKGCGEVFDDSFEMTFGEEYKSITLDLKTDDIEIGKFAKGGGVEKAYNVFNYTDNVYATDEVFKTKKSANEFIKEFRNRFSRQGYYRDNQMNKIAIEDIDLLAIPTDFSPFRKMKEGGSIAEGNYHMILSQAKEVKHHVDELQDILKKEDSIEAWVVAKMENVSSTLSDVTHYLDGKSDMPKAKRGMKVGENKDELEHYAVEVEYGEGNIDVDIKTKSFDEAERKFNEVVEDMKFNKEINVVKLDAVFKSGVVETIDSEYREDFYGDTYENEDYEEYAKGGKTRMAKRGMKVGTFPFLKYEDAQDAMKKVNEGELPKFFSYVENEKTLYYLPDIVGKWVKLKSFKSKKDSIDWIKSNLQQEGFAEGGETRMAKRGMKVDKIEYPSISLKERDLNDDQAEIYGFIENYEPLNRQMDAIRKNLMTKIARGQFDEKKAPKIFMYLIDNGLKSYEKLHGDIELSKKEKAEMANNMVIDFMSEAEQGNYENETFLPKKYLAEDGMFIMTYDVYDQDGDLVGFGLASQEVIDYANLIWYYDMMDEDGEEIDDIDVAIDFLEQSEFNIERHNPKNSSSATKKKKVRRASVK